MKPLIAFIALLTAVNPLQAQDKAVLREISGAFEKIEADFETWPHHTYGAENLEGGQAYEHSVWKSDGDKGFIKVESLNFDEHGESKTQFFFKDSQLLFTLDRSETVRMVPDAPTEVSERRYYFANNRLIRVLEKQGKFPNGKPTDTAELKNRELPLDDIENAAETYTTQHEIAAGIFERARALEEDADAAPADAPASNRSGEGWREIAGSGSRDGMYALAWGLKDQDEIEGETDEDGTLSVEPENESLVNYVVNLRTNSIVGSIKGKHFGDKSTYNHLTTETAWSAASMFVAQTNSGKWATFDSNVYELEYGKAVSKGADLLDATKKAIFTDSKTGELFKQFDKDSFTTTLHDVHIAQRGPNMIVSVEASLMIPKSEEEGSNLDATVVFTIDSNENGGAPLLHWIGTDAH